MMSLTGCAQTYGGSTKEKSDALARQVVATFLTNSDVGDNKNLRDIGYSGGTPSRVYVQECGKYEPYFVVSSKQDSSAILVREFVLNEPISYSSSDSVSSYYPRSNVDAYLSTTHLESFESALQEMIGDTALAVAVQGATAASATEVINRKAFVLSAAELGAKDRFHYIWLGPPFYKQLTHDPQAPS